MCKTKNISEILVHKGKCAVTNQPAGLVSVLAVRMLPPVKSKVAGEEGEEGGALDTTLRPVLVHYRFPIASGLCLSLSTVISYLLIRTAQT